MVARGITCPHCGKHTDKDTNYCKNCGKRLRGLGDALPHCPSCKRFVHVGSTYCHHCGSSLSGGRRVKPRSILPHIAIFLLIVLALFLLYSYPLPVKKTTTVENIPEEATILISHLSCDPIATGYKVCGDVSWSNGAYAKAHIPGGEELDAAQKQFTPFTYCQSVGSDKGFHVFRAFVYDASGNLLVEHGDGVMCAEKPKKQTVQQPYTYSFTKKILFYTENQYNRPEGTGTVLVNLPDPVVSCTADGSFYTENGGERQGTISFKPLQYCDGATGNFSGFVSSLGQSVTTDAHSFMWDGNVRQDPVSTVHDGYLMFAYTCDSQYYMKKRYYTSVTASGLGTTNLALNWYYKNDDTHPRLYFDALLNCILKKA